MSWLDRLIHPLPDSVVEFFDPILETQCSVLPPWDAHELHIERAAIIEHDAGMSRDQAEHLVGLGAEVRTEVSIEVSSSQGGYQ